MRPRSKSIGLDPLSSAIKELRETIFKESQQKFAARLGVAVTTVARWETGRVPDGKFLMKLRELALEKDQEQLAGKFFSTALKPLYEPSRVGDKLNIPTGVFGTSRSDAVHALEHLVRLKKTKLSPEQEQILKHAMNFLKSSIRWHQIEDGEPAQPE